MPLVGNNRCLDTSDTRKVSRIPGHTGVLQLLRHGGVLMTTCRGNMDDDGTRFDGAEGLEIKWDEVGCKGTWLNVGE